jgi:spermidine synthase
MNPRRFLPALFVLFVGSGCAALIYEIVWFQLLQLIIGSSSISLGMLLGTFMGGMCLGSLLLSRMISARHHPLRVYAGLELGIGVLALLILVAMPLVGGIYTAWGGEGVFGIIFRAVVAGICLLPPTMLMGATLPAISRWVKATPDGVSWLGFFYGGNIAGGVFGCVLAGFYLLRVFDVATATAVAVALNLAVARLPTCSPRGRRTRPTSSRRRAPAPPPARSTAVYVTIALSGLTALSAEVIWTRLLSLHFGATVYTFALILAVFLVGLRPRQHHRRVDRAEHGVAPARARLVPAAAVRRGRVGGLPADAVAAVLAINPYISTTPWFTLQLAYGPLHVGDAARRDALGRELSAGARAPSPPPSRMRRAWPAASTPPNTVGAIVGSR